MYNINLTFNDAKSCLTLQRDYNAVVFYGNMRREAGRLLLDVTNSCTGTLVSNKYSDCQCLPLDWHRTYPS